MDDFELPVCDNCGRKIPKGELVTNVGDSFDVIIFCALCTRKH